MTSSTPPTPGCPSPIPHSPDLRLVYTRAQGIRVLGAIKGDGVWFGINACACIAHRLLEVAHRLVGIFAPRSAGRPDHALINTTAQALRDAGFTVTIETEESA